MIQQFPIWINFLFLIGFIYSIILFFYANSGAKLPTLLIVAIAFIQSTLSISGFYHVTDGFPPRFIFILLPSVILMIYGLLPKSIRWMRNNRRAQISVFIHVVRIPVEICLYYLFLHEMVPELMTFEGRNFDILAGITAPILGFLYLKKIISAKILLTWNIIGLGLVSFILFNGLLSARTPFQQFAFDQPNIGLEYFPYILLPSIIVPLVIYTHLTDILNLKNMDLSESNI